jgi:hypothetical protein
MPKGIKGFAKGHTVSAETRKKISMANKGEWVTFKCAYCGKEKQEKLSHFKKRKRHFCCRYCYSRYREEYLPKEEQPSYGTGYTVDERLKRRKARSIFNHYLRDNCVEKRPCEICGEKAEAHHDDYDKPLEVRWLCFKHHREWHKDHDTPELLDREERKGNHGL